MITAKALEDFLVKEMNDCADEVIENKVKEMADLLRQEMIKRKSAIITELMCQIKMTFEVNDEIIIRFKP